MGCFKDLFTTAGEKRQLIREVEFHEGVNKKLQWKVDALEKLVIAERKAKDKLQVALLDYVARREGGVGRFNEAIEKEKAPDPPQKVLSADDEAMVWEAAEIMRNNDIINGLPPHELEEYAVIIRQAPDKYILN